MSRTMLAMCMLFWQVVESFALERVVRFESIKKIAVGAEIHGLGITPDGRKLFVSDITTDSASIIDLETNSISSTVTTCRQPWVFAPVPDGTRMLTGCRDGLAIIDIATRKARLVHCCGWIWSIVVSSDSRTAYLAAERAGLFQLDLQTLSVTLVDSTPAVMYLALARDNRTLFIAYQSGGPGGRFGHDAIGKYDLSTRKLVATATGLPNVGGPLILNQDEQYLWANGTDACLSRRYDHTGCPVVPAGVVNILRTSTMQTVHTIPWVRPGIAWFLRLEPLSKLVLVNGLDPVVYDSKSFEPVGKISGLHTVDGVFNPDATRLYVTAPGERVITVLKVSFDSGPARF